MARKRRLGCKWIVLLLLASLVGAPYAWFRMVTGGSEHGPAKTVIFTKQRRLSSVIDEFAQAGYIKNAFATKVLAVVKGVKRTIAPGAYSLSTGMSSEEALDALKSPIKQMVRVPEERWIARVAKVLEDKNVCKAADYIALSNQSGKFEDMGIPFFNESLEGFLYPDTYNFAPGIGAEWVIRRQLMNFQKKTEGLGLTKENVRRTLIIASLLELEASDYKEKQMIAGVIENRLMHGMRLQIDATVNYGLQLWRPLVYADYTSVKSPYNTYLYKGLPPGPICSPTVDSIKAALNPIKHNMVYYITMPDGVTRFTATYKEHLVNVKLRDKLKAQKKATQ
ncbi:MAG: endolytic transglycosylase MltG [Armatimonadetes bacterium]|nr:endolytic transglycosylase MltG [Armatimonadota bacterium]